MKVLLSWLNDFGTSPTRPSGGRQRSPTRMTALGLAVDGDRPRRRPVAGVIIARVLRLEPHPDADKVQRVYVDAGDGARARSGAARSTCSPATSCRSPRSARRCPTAARSSARRIRGTTGRTACSARPTSSASATTTRGILILPARHPARRAVRRGARHRPDVVFDLDLTRNRPDCWGHSAWPATWPPTSASPFTPAGARRSTSRRRRRARRRSRSSTASAAAGSRARSSPVSRVEPVAARGWRDRLTAAGMRPINNVVDVSQLRDARAQPAEPRLRPRHARRRRVPHPRAPARASRS